MFSGTAELHVLISNHSFVSLESSHTVFTAGKEEAFFRSLCIVLSVSGWGLLRACKIFLTTNLLLVDFPSIQVSASLFFVISLGNCKLRNLLFVCVCSSSQVSGHCCILSKSSWLHQGLTDFSYLFTGRPCLQWCRPNAFPCPLSSYFTTGHTSLSVFVHSKSYDGL